MAHIKLVLKKIRPRSPLDVFMLLMIILAIILIIWNPSGPEYPPLISQ